MDKSVAPQKLSRERCPKRVQVNTIHEGREQLTAGECAKLMCSTFAQIHAGAGMTN